MAAWPRRAKVEASRPRSFARRSPIRAGLTHQISPGFGPVHSINSRSSTPRGAGGWRYCCPCAWPSPSTDQSSISKPDSAEDSTRPATWPPPCSPVPLLGLLALGTRWAEGGAAAVPGPCRLPCTPGGRAGPPSRASPHAFPAAERHMESTYRARWIGRSGRRIHRPPPPRAVPKAPRNPASSARSRIR
jgi:hypothetical protein